MGPVPITLLLAVAFTSFAVLAARKLALLRHLRPEVRWDAPFARLRTVVVNGFLQSRMIRREWKPGVMHAAIFLGFVTLLVRKLQLVAIGYDESATIPGLAGGLFAAFKDVIELAVLVACGYALYRRLVQKPRAARAQSRGAPRPGADRLHHDHRLRVRRVPFRAAVGRRSRHRARARVRVPRQRARVVRWRRCPRTRCGSATTRPTGSRSSSCSRSS